MTPLHLKGTLRPGADGQRGRMGNVDGIACAPPLPRVPGTRQCALIFLAIAIPPVQRGRDHHEESFFDFFTDDEREEATQNIIALLGAEGVRDVIRRRLRGD